MTATFTCKIDETQQGTTEDREALDRFLEPKDDILGTTAFELVAKAEAKIGIRKFLWVSYEMPRIFYNCDGLAGIVAGSAPQRIRDLGCLIYYACEEESCAGIGMTRTRRKRPAMDVDELVKRWHETIVGLAMAHDKDGVDRYESAVEECLSPILTAPVKQLREFGPKLLESLKADTSVPYLIWRAYEVWIDQMDKAPDEDIVTLKKELAADIVKMVEEDAKAQLPDAMVRALMWRSPSTLEKVKEVVTEEKAAGRSVRVKGRESCLFLEAGPDPNAPLVCVQI